jgi:hypothetical protein
MSSPNRDALVRIAGILGPIARELVFVGGRVAELLVSEPGTTRVRPTDDSDAICQVATRTEYHRFGERLRGVGFREDQTPGAPMCRWRHEEDILDVMPVDGELLGFENAWYHHAVRLAADFEVAPGVVIHIAPAPVFLATKWDAFNGRGAEDWYGSHDLEDIVAVVAGRPELVDELRATEGDVRQYVASQTRTLLDSGLADAVVAGALPDARVIPDLVMRVIERLGAISRLSDIG